MKKFLKGLGIALLIFMVVGGAVYAYTALTVSSTVEVKEPISITSATGSGTFDSATNTWNIGQLYPAGTASLTITFANASSGKITLTLTANPASHDSGNLTFTFDKPAVEVPGGSTAAVIVTANTTQSLKPGNYSTQIAVVR